jgi:hypothetical protein
VGWVQIIWGAKDAAPIPTRFGHRIYHIPDNGILRTSSEPDRRWSTADEYYYHSATGMQVIDPSKIYDIESDLLPAMGQPVIHSEEIFIGDPKLMDKIPSSQVGPLKVQ